MMNKHAAWILPALGIPGCIVAAVALAMLVQPARPGLTILAGLSALVLLVVGPILCLILFIRNGYPAYREARNRRGHFTGKEQKQLALVQAHKNAYQQARMLTNALADGQAPPEIQVWGLVLRPQERAYMNITADYARFYGGSGVYTHTNEFFWGRPAFMFAGMAATAIGNSSRRKAAAAEAQQRWREVQTTQMILTSDRIICLVGGQWLSFFFADVSTCYPEPANHSLVMEFFSTEPLLVGGIDAPLAAVFSVWALHGQHGIRDHPAMTELKM